MLKDRTDLENAIQYARLKTLDDRDLMPLEEARDIVRKATEFKKGRGRRKGGTIVLDSDILWAALLSLKDAREFVRHARRLVWSIDPRGDDSTALAERYGAGILPWLADHLEEDGDLINSPALICSSLLAIDTKKSFELVWDIKQVDGSPRAAERLFRQWMEANPKVGYPLLASLAETGDRRARKLFRHLANLQPGLVFDMVRARRGKAATTALFEGMRIVSRLTESAILSLLDLCAERDLNTAGTPWPLFNSKKDGSSVFHGMRLIAARARTGNDWGVVIERITGTSARNAVVEAYLYGNKTSPGKSSEHTRPLKFSTIREEEEDLGLDGVVVMGPAGKLALSNNMVKKHGIRTKNLGVRDPEAAAFILRLRTYMANFPQAFWIDPVMAAAPLGLGDDFDVILVSDRFTHVLGTDASDVSGRDKFWLARPSDTRVYRSMARAMVERDSSLFRPGKSNLEWR